MPHTVKVISAGDFIRAQPEGKINFEEAEGLLKQIAEAAGSLEDYQVLVDLRNVTSRLTPAELFSLARTVALHRRREGTRTAILVPFERFDKARFFALCAENRGVNIHSFTDYEQAMEWLLAGG
jgi:hypothetical protein